MDDNFKRLEVLVRRGQFNQRTKHHQAMIRNGKMFRDLDRESYAKHRTFGIYSIIMEAHEHLPNMHFEFRASSTATLGGMVVAGRQVLAPEYLL